MKKEAFLERLEALLQDIPEEDIDLILGQVDLMLRRVKIKNKEKYNPNKNKK